MILCTLPNVLPKLHFLTSRDLALIQIHWYLSSHFQQCEIFYSGFSPLQSRATSASFLESRPTCRCVNVKELLSSLTVFLQRFSLLKLHLSPVSSVVGFALRFFASAVYSSFSWKFAKAVRKWWASPGKGLDDPVLQSLIFGLPKSGCVEWLALLPSLKCHWFLYARLPAWVSLMKVSIYSSSQKRIGLFAYHEILVLFFASQRPYSSHFPALV